MELTQEYLKSVLHYDPETGVFTWRTSRGGSNAGAEAGYIHKTLGYRMISISLTRRKMFYAHRLAFMYVTGRMPGEVDHINRSRSDNRWANIREVTRGENSRNHSMASNNTSGCTGVYFNKARKKWQAYISEDSAKYLGVYDDWFDAVCARKSAENRLGYHPAHGR